MACTGRAGKSKAVAAPVSVVVLLVVAGRGIDLSPIAYA